MNARSSITSWLVSSPNSVPGGSRTLLAVALLGLAAACGGGSGGSGGGSDTRTVTGQRLWNYLSLNSSTGALTVTQEPATTNDTSTYIRAQLLDGTRLPGTYNNTTGNFSIPNVPSGQYWLVRYDYSYVLTDASAVDLSLKQAGRSTVAYPTAQTDVTFNVGGLTNWKADDYLVFYDFNSNLYSQSELDAYTHAPVVGDNMLSGMIVDWHAPLDAGGPLPLVDTTRGDAPQLVHMVTTPNGAGENLQIGSRLYVPSSPLTLASGSPATLTGNFASLATNTSVNVNYNRAEFTLYRSQYNPNKVQRPARITFMDTPGATAHGFVGAGLDVLYCANTPPTTTNLALGAIDVPAPPRGFERVVMAGDRYTMSWTAPGASHAWTLAGRVYTYSTTLPTSSAPVRPLVSPARNPMINGASLFADRTGVGLTPTLSWTQPDLGTPKGYIITVWHLTNSSGWTSGTDVARLIVPGNLTSVKLPAGILSAGEAYAIQIRAVVDGGWNPTAAPYLNNRFPYGFADTLTNMIRP